MSGRISIAGEHVAEGGISSISGAVDFSGDLAGPGNVGIETRSGKVTVQVPEAPSVRYDISTLSGGIENEFGPQPQRVHENGPGLRLKFGPDSGPALRIETLSGGIALKKP